MKANFVLRGGKIQVKVKSGNVHYRKSMGIDCAIENWDDTRKSVRGSSEWSKRVNAFLDKTAAEYNERISLFQIETGRSPNGAELAEIFGEKKRTATKLRDYAEKYIDGLKSKTNQRTGVLISRVTVTKQRTVLEKLICYEQECGQIVTLAKADIGFYNGFRDWMVGMDYSMNTIGKHLDIIKTWLREADADGKEVNPAYRGGKWTAPRERKENVYLSTEELMKLKALDLVGPLRITRDCFLISAFTGLRYSDMSRLNQAVLRDGKIELEQQKTFSRVVIPLHPVVSAIFKDYTGAGKQLPVPLSNQKMNEGLKSICKLAGIDDDCVFRITKGGKRIEERVKKYELISTHTARRSFARNLYMENFALDALMVVMGHSKIEQTREYIGVKQLDNAELLAQHWKKRG